MEGTDFDERYSCYVDNLLHKTNFKSSLKDAHSNSGDCIKKKISEKGNLLVVISLSVVIGFLFFAFSLFQESGKVFLYIVLFGLIIICVIIAVNFYKRFEQQIVSHIFDVYIFPKAVYNNAFKEQTSELLSLAADIHRIHGFISITGNAMIGSRSHELSEDETSSLSTILTFADELDDVENRIRNIAEYNRYAALILEDYNATKEIYDYIKENA